MYKDSDGQRRGWRLFVWILGFIYGMILWFALPYILSIYFSPFAGAIASGVISRTGRALRRNERHTDKTWILLGFRDSLIFGLIITVGALLVINLLPNFKYVKPFVPLLENNVRELLFGYTINNFGEPYNQIVTAGLNSLLYAITGAISISVLVFAKFLSSKLGIDPSSLLTKRAIVVFLFSAVAIGLFLSVLSDKTTRYQLLQLVGVCEIRERYVPAIAQESYRILIAVYIADSKNYTVPYTDSDIRQFLAGNNQIWGQYKIQFYLYDEIKRISNLADSDVLIGRSGNTTADAVNLGKKLIGEGIYSDVIKIFFVKSFYNFTTPLGTIVTNGIGVNSGGVSAIFVSGGKNMSWIIAHELAHVLGNVDERKEDGKFTLMTHEGCIVDRYYPTVLNQTQYNYVFEKIKSIKHERLGE